MESSSATFSSRKTGLVPVAFVTTSKNENKQKVGNWIQRQCLPESEVDEWNVTVDGMRGWRKDAQSLQDSSVLSLESCSITYVCTLQKCDRFQWGRLIQPFNECELNCVLKWKGLQPPVPSRSSQGGRKAAGPSTIIQRREACVRRPGVWGEGFSLARRSRGSVTKKMALELTSLWGFEGSLLGRKDRRRLVVGSNFYSQNFFCFNPCSQSTPLTLSPVAFPPCPRTLTPCTVT